MQPIAMSIRDATRFVGLSRSSIYTMINDNRIETVCVGKRRLVKTASLVKLVEGAK